MINIAPLMDGYVCVIEKPRVDYIFKYRDLDYDEINKKRFCLGWEIAHEIEDIKLEKLLTSRDSVLNDIGIILFREKYEKEIYVTQEGRSAYRGNCPYLQRAKKSETINRLRRVKKTIF